MNAHFGKSGLALLRQRADLDQLALDASCAMPVRPLRWWAPWP